MFRSLSRVPPSLAVPAAGLLIGAGLAVLVWFVQLYGWLW